MAIDEKVKPKTPEKEFLEHLKYIGKSFARAHKERYDWEKSHDDLNKSYEALPKDLREDYFNDYKDALQRIEDGKEMSP